MSVGDGLATLEKEELAFSDEQLEDEAALKIVLQDAQFAQQYLNSKNLPIEWNNNEDLYRAYVPLQKWPNSDKLRAHLSMPVVLEAIETLLPQVYLSFFSDYQPFLLEAQGKTPAEAARAMSKLVCWAIDYSGFKEEIRKALKSDFQFGQCVAKWGWCTRKYNRRTYKRDESGKIVRSAKSKDISHPTFEFVELRNILVDGALRNHDIRQARYVIHRVFLTADELDALREEYKNVPSREQLKEILAAGSEPTENSLSSTESQTWRENQAEYQDKETSVDPLKKPLEILEYWTDDKVITVLQRKIVLRNEENEFGCKPFLSCAFIDVLGAFYGFGVSKLLEGEQQLQTGVANAWVDALNLLLNPTWHRKKGVGATSQNVSLGPGRVVNDDGELTPLPIPDISQSALMAIEASNARASRRVGANGGSEMPNQAMRTAEGVQSFTAGVQVKLQYFVDNFSEQVFIPAILAFIEMCREYLSEEDVKSILSEEEAEAYTGDMLDVYNGRYAVSVLDSTKLAARRAMASLLPSILQLVSAAPVQQALMAQGNKFDWVELLKQVITLTNWPMQDLIVKATPEDIQRFMMMQPGVAQAQARADAAKQEQQNALEQIEAKGTTQAGVAVVKHVLQQSGAHDESMREIASQMAQPANPPAGPTPPGQSIDQQQAAQFNQAPGQAPPQQ